MRYLCLPLFALTAALMLHVGEPQLSAQPKKKDPPKKQPVSQPEDLFVAPGFKAELLYVSDPGTEGSWINMCPEKPGKLIIAGQGGQPILRFTIKDGRVEGTPEKLPLGISEAMGLLYVKDALYVNGSGPKGYGLYKCVEGESTWKVTPLKIFGSGGEHGAHGLALGRDGKIYVMNGNHTKVPEVDPNPPYFNYKEDHVVPRQWDGNGHAAGIYAPGGYVVRVDTEGKTCELVLGGFRNAYDHTFNGDGELFTFDSDMEWDWGMPWYRPTRVNHCTVGSEHGWRSGTGVWPDYYPDNLPPVVNIGIGSPTGVGNGAGAKFPAKYQKAIYICDWTYGRLMAVHLKPKGATYEATFENFVCPLGLMKPGAAKKPLNVTDTVIGSDGAMYVTIGGRNAQSALYRITYTGDESTAPADLTNKEGAEARELRHKLEAFHGHQDKDATNTAIKHIGSEDRAIRFAARVALESQPLVEWKTLVLKDQLNVDGRLTGLLALARTGDAKTQPEILAALDALGWDKLTDAQKLDKLRVLQVSFTRQGPPAGGAKKLIAELDSAFPGSNESFNREAFELLVFLNAPGIVSKGLKKMAEAKTQQDLFHYLFHLRTAPIGSWTLDQRKTYLGYWPKRPNLPQEAETLAWFKAAGRDYSNGSSFNNFLKNFLREAVANMSDAEKKELAPTIASINKDITPSFDTKPREVVKKWTMEEMLPLLAKVESGRDFNKGKEAYAASQCIKCHRFGETGGSIGPDLTAIGSRFAAKDILESIIDPSKTLSDQYQNETFRTSSGKTVTGRVVDDTKDSIAVQPDPLSPERVVIKKDDLESRTPSKVSPMPASLADVLTQDEILDLIAYMQAAGKKTKAFK